MISEVKFTKVCDNKYIATGIEDIFIKARDIVTEVSLGELDRYDTITNDNMILMLVARMLGGAFFKAYLKDEVTINKQYPSVLISVQDFGVADFSVGLMLTKNREIRVTDVIYR